MPTFYSQIGENGNLVRPDHRGTELPQDALLGAVGAAGQINALIYINTMANSIRYRCLLGAFLGRKP